MRTLILIAFIAIVILLQIYLSKRASKWPGLVLPIMAFLFGLLFPLNMVAPSDGVNGKLGLCQRGIRNYLIETIEMGYVQLAPLYGIYIVLLLVSSDKRSR